MTLSDVLSVAPSGYNSTVYSYASVNSSYPLSRPVGNGSSGTTYSQWNLKTGANAESYVFYQFNLSAIPAGAIINSISCSAKAYINTTTSSRVSARQIQLFYGTSQGMGGASTISTSTSAISMSCGVWSREQLQNCNIRIYAKRGTSNTTSTYYCRFYGAILTVSYTYEAQSYTITTTVTGNGSVNPNTPQEVLRGESLRVLISPNEQGQAITVTDNGSDVTSQLVDYGGSTDFSVVPKDGASYGFEQEYDENCREGWWQSSNRGQASSAAVSTVEMTITKKTNIIVSIICYAESTYDYFLMSGLDQELSVSASADSSAVYTTKNSNSAKVQTYTFENVSPGFHTFDVKYFKDSYTNSNWDSAQFTVEYSVPQGSEGMKEYVLTNISSDHVIAVVFAGDDSRGVFMKINGIWRKVILYKKAAGAWVRVSDYQSELSGLNIKASE